MGNREIRDLVNNTSDRLWAMYNKIYSEDSNDLFDALHDDIYYQLQGYETTREEFFAELKTTESQTVGWANSWLRSLKDDIEMVEQIEAYYKAVTKAPEISWVYA